MPFRFRVVIIRLLLVAIAILSLIGRSWASSEDVGAHDHDPSHRVGAAASSERWEGSLQGKIYSERNHQAAAWVLLVLGLSELAVARCWSSKWTAGVLPTAMLATGFFLLIWSDHDAWPIGRLGWAETFLGQDTEVLQHKWFGVSSLLVGGLEGARRMGWLTQKIWALVIPLYAMAGGGLLLMHDHGHHPSVHEITMHHRVMGVLAIMAGGAKMLAIRADESNPRDRHAPSGRSGPAPKWSYLWAGLVLVIGALLMTYRE